MLVKLGDIWVSPIKVEAVYDDPDSGNIGIDTEKRSYLTVKNGNTADSYAELVNNAIGQSYGGADEEKPKEA